MDHISHISLAYRLLELCNLDKTACIYSLLPALDREPAHFHRVYGHIIAKFPSILTSAIQILSGKDTAADTTTYEFERINADKTYYEKIVEQALPLVGDESILTPSSDVASGALALLSHIYVDTFNNPVQAFLPQSTSCSGQWKFWLTVNYLSFREKFYTKETIEKFRKSMFTTDLWKGKMDAYTLMKSMIIRLGDLAIPGVEYETIDNILRDFLHFTGCSEYVRPDKELKFCHSLENKIATLIPELIK
ncbi:MAG: hypothetical protein ABIH76_01330 [Candidatus Bathyarchaeota archaeon]